MANENQRDENQCEQLKEKVREGIHTFINNLEDFTYENMETAWESGMNVEVSDEYEEAKKALENYSSKWISEIEKLERGGRQNG